MKKYLVDMHRLRHNPYNGLYIFCYRLGEHLLNQPLAEEELYYYLPRGKFGLYGNRPHYVAHKRFHKFFQTGTGRFNVWHLTTGISQYRPFNKKTKVVYTIHDVNFLLESPDNLNRNNRTLKLMQHNVDRADYIAFVSKYAMEFASRHLNFNEKPVTVIYNGYTVDEFPDFDNPVYKPTHPFLFSISLVQPRKNYHVLPPLLQHNDYELIIAGLNHFDYAKIVMEEARRWKVENRVKLIGPIDDKNKYWYYQHCKAFVFPSLAEGFGFPPLEAMHFGKAVFLSDRMSLPELGGNIAYYFHDFDPAAMQSVFEKGMKDAEITDSSGKIKQQAASFSWDNTAKKYLEIYRSLI